MIEFEIRPSKNPTQPYYWRIVSENGKILASSETYEHKEDINKAVGLVRKGAVEAKYVDYTIPAVPKS